MLAILGGNLDLAERRQLYVALASLKNQSLESKSVQEELLLPMEAYTAYKKDYRKNIQFDPFVHGLNPENFCKYEISASSAHSASLGQMT